MLKYRVTYTNGESFVVKAADRNEAMKWAHEMRPAASVKSIEIVESSVFEYMFQTFFGGAAL